MEGKIKKNPVTLQLDVSDFLPADESEKQSLVVMRESSSFFKDGVKRLQRNPIAMTSLIVIIIVMIFAFIVPRFWPYTYKEQIRGSGKPCTYGVLSGGAGKAR